MGLSIYHGANILFDFIILGLSVLGNVRGPKAVCKCKSSYVRANLKYILRLARHYFIYGVTFF